MKKKKVTKQCRLFRKHRWHQYVSGGMSRMMKPFITWHHFDVSLRYTQAHRISLCTWHINDYYMADIVRELWLVSLPVHNLRYGPQMLPTSPLHVYSHIKYSKHPIDLVCLVRTVSYGSWFFCLFLWPARFCALLGLCLGFSLLCFDNKRYLYQLKSSITSILSEPLFPSTSRKIPASMKEWALVGTKETIWN